MPTVNHYEPSWKGRILKIAQDGNPQMGQAIFYIWAKYSLLKQAKEQSSREIA